MKYVIYLGLIVFLMTSCSLNDKNNNNYKFLKIRINKTKTIDLKDISYGLLTSPEIIKVNNDLHLIYAVDFGYIHILPIENPKKVKKIKIPMGDIVRVIYLNVDSIFVVYNPHENLNEDFQLLLIDTAGNIHKKINILKKSNFKNAYIGWLSTTFIVNNNYLPLTFNSVKNYITHDIDTFPQIGYYDLLKDIIIINKSLFLPDFKENYKLTTHSYLAYLSPAKNSFLIRYIYSPYLYKWDLNKNVTSKILIKSNIIDSIYTFNNFLNAIFTEVKYDPIRKYYFFVCIPLLDFSESYKPFFIVTDSSFNYITETTEKIFFNTYFDNEENISYSLNGDKIELTYFNYYFENVDKKQYNDYTSSIKNDIIKKQNEMPDLICKITKEKDLTKTYDVSLLINNYYKLKDDNYWLLATYGDVGCVSCNEELFEFFSKNFIYFKNNNLYLLVSSSKKFARYLNEKFQLKNYPYLILDTLNIYKYFDKSAEYIPRLLKVKNKKIIFDKYYNLNNRDSLYQELLKISIKR